MTLQTIPVSEREAFRQNTAIRAIIEILNTSNTISASEGQIAFPATQNPSTDPNTLDDYEEGSWTPTVEFATTNGNLSVVYSVREARYVKIGRLVWVNFQVITSTFTHTTASGNLMITGLPFTIEANGESFCPLIFGGITGPVGATQFVGDFLGTTDEIRIWGSGVGVGPSGVTEPDVPSGGTLWLQGSSSYRATA